MKKAINKVFLIEDKIMNYIVKHIYVTITILVTVLSLIIRFSLRNIQSNDYTQFLEQWYYQIIDNGRLGAFKVRIGNYNIAYLTCIALLSYLPLKPLYIYKILSTFFDYAIAIFIGLVINKETKKRNLALIAYSMILFWPSVILNSSLWSQCDSIYTFFCLMALYFLIKKNNKLSFFFLGIAFAFKLQTVFVLPVIGFIIIFNYKNNPVRIYQMLITPLTLFLSGVPSYLINGDLLVVYKIYKEQTNTYGDISLNYPSFWNLLASNRVFSPIAYEEAKLWCICFTIFVIFMLYLLFKDVEMNLKNLIMIAFVIIYTTIIFLPAMHERYGYIYEILAIIVALIGKKRLAWICIFVELIAIITYGRFLYDADYNILQLSIINVILYFICVNSIYREISYKEQRKECRV